MHCSCPMNSAKGVGPLKKKKVDSLDADANPNKA